MPRAPVNGTDLFYLELGSGLPFLIMHGGLGVDHTQFRCWLDPLYETLRLIYYDHRCNGRSGRPAIETLTHEQLCADADALRAAVGAERVAVMGHSYGGCLALEYALCYPQRVSHLILVGTTAAWDYTDALAAELERRCVPATVVEALLRLPETDAEAERNVKAQTVLSFHPSNRHLGSVMFEETIWSAAANARSRLLGAGFNVVDRLAEIQAPTLIMVGRDDFYCPPTQAERMHRHLPNSTLVVFERSGHYPFAEEPNAFRAALRSWLQSHGPAAAPETGEARTHHRARGLPT